MSTAIALTPRGTIEQRRNLINNPSARRGAAGYTASGGTIVSEPGLDCYLSATGVSTPGNATIGLEAFTIGGGKLLPNTQYTFSASIYGSATSASIYAGGTGVVGGGAQSGLQPAGGTFVRQSVTFTTTAAGPVTLYLLNSSTTAAGNIIAFRDAQLETGAAATAYLDGSLPAAGAVTYAWTGTVDASASVQLLVDPATLLAPDLILGYQTSRKSNNVVHRILSSSTPAITLHESEPRSGELQLLFTAETAALNALAVLSRVGTFTLTDTDRPSVGMSFAVINAVTYALDNDTRTRLVLTVPYQEIR